MVQSLIADPRGRPCRLVLVLVGTFGVSALAFTVAAAASATRVTVKGPDGDFHVKLISQNTHASADAPSACSCPTTVGSTFQRIGQDTSSRGGSMDVWSIANSGSRDGLLYPCVTRARVSSGKGPTIELANDVPQ
jgi:hypothetical protein